MRNILIGMIIGASMMLGIAQAGYHGAFYDQERYVKDATVAPGTSIAITVNDTPYKTRTIPATIDVDIDGDGELETKTVISAEVGLVYTERLNLE